MTKFSRKIRNYIITGVLKFSFMLKLKRIPVLPNVIDLEPTNLCNLKCSHCPNPYWVRKKKNLRLDQFEYIVRQLPNLMYIKLQGIGEPFLNPELFEMIRKAEDFGIDVGLTTNGMVYNDKIRDGMQKIKKMKITVSVDALSNDVVQILRRGSHIDTLKKNIASLREDSKFTCNDFSFWSVITKDNIHGLLSIIMFGKSVDVNSISFQMFLNDWSSEQIKNIIVDQKIEDIYDYQSEIEEAKIMANENKVQLNVVTQNYYTRNNKCIWPYTRIFIDVDGNVVPCCIISDAAVITMGNVFEQPLQEIWNSEKYIQFREDIKTHNLRDYCKNCYSE